MMASFYDDPQRAMMVEEKNPVSVLMEFGQSHGKTPEFKELCAMGESHNPRFLCQWSYNSQEFPAVFATSKKEGKKLSAILALEGLKLRTEPVRKFVTYNNRQGVNTLVEASSTLGMDQRLFTAADITPATNAAHHVAKTSIERSMQIPFGKESQDSRLAPGLDPPRNGFSSRGTETRTMQAFDKQTIEALARRNRSFITSFSMMKREPTPISERIVPPRQAFATQSSDSPVLLADIPTVAAEMPAPVPPAAEEPVSSSAPGATADTNSLDLTGTLLSLKLEEGPSNGVGLMDHNEKLSSPNSSCGQNPISALYELGQKCGIQPEYKVLGQTGPPHQPIFLCKCAFGDVESVVNAPSKDRGKQLAFKEVFSQVSCRDLLQNRQVAGSAGAATAADVGKNPISLVMELGNKLSIIPEFECEQLSMTPISRFRGYCQFGSRRYGPVEAQNKQQTKTEVFKIAWEKLNSDPTVKADLARQTHQINSGSTLQMCAAAATVGSRSGSPVDTEAMQNLLSQKHPVSAILEYAQARRLAVQFEEVDDTGPAHCRNFTYRCEINGRRYPEARARTKKDAKKHAAELALRAIAGATTSATVATAPVYGATAAVSNVMEPAASSFRSEQREVTQPKSLTLLSTSSQVKSKSDIIASQVLSQFGLIKVNCVTDLGKVILAGFVLENSLIEESQDPEKQRLKYDVISIGTGNKCLAGQHISMNGTAVNDCHAEVIARRGLLRFLYAQVGHYRKDPTSSIFEQIRGKKAVLRSHFKLHLYISTAPCGDGALFTHNCGDLSSDLSNYSLEDEHSPVIEQHNQGQLRSKMEVGEGTIPTIGSPPQTYDGIGRGDRLKTMSCSDKICKWNVLGVQGTLLSDFIQPIYIDTVLLGQLFHPGHLSRAFCCRIRQFADKLTAGNSGFQLNHVKIDAPELTLPRSTTKSKPVSLNWMKYDRQCEVLTAETGQVIPVGSDQLVVTNSRLCKRELYERYKGLKDSSATHCYYGEAKTKVVEYTKTKMELYKEFCDTGLGSWLSKPVEQNMFR